MRRTLALTSLFVACLCAIGSVWDVVQVFAWTRMFAGYAAELPVGAALRATFDPAKPCEICRAVARAKATEQRQAPAPVEHAAEKLLLACDAPANLLFLRSRPEWPPAPAESGPQRPAAVPVPPPRARVA
jgi:hypothetical protein